MKQLAEIGRVIGGLLLVFSAIVTFKFDMPEYIENIIYFRGILGGGLLLFVGSAITNNKIIYQNIYISLAAGTFTLLVASTCNLIFDEAVRLDLYFDLTIWTVGLGVIILMIIRLWLRRILKYLKSLYLYLISHL